VCVWIGSNVLVHRFNRFCYLYIPSDKALVFGLMPHHLLLSASPMEFQECCHKPSVSMTVSWPVQWHVFSTSHSMKVICWHRNVGYGRCEPIEMAHHFLSRMAALKLVDRPQERNDKGVIREVCVCNNRLKKKPPETMTRVSITFSC
jgi:hypothetical protein